MPMRWRRLRPRLQSCRAIPALCRSKGCGRPWGTMSRSQRATIGRQSDDPKITASAPPSLLLATDVCLRFDRATWCRIVLNVRGAHLRLGSAAVVGSTHRERASGLPSSIVPLRCLHRGIFGTIPRRRAKRVLEWQREWFESQEACRQPSRP